MTCEFTGLVNNVSDDPFTWNLKIDWNGVPGSPDEIEVRNAQSEYLHNVPLEEIHHMHLFFDPDGIQGTIMGMGVTWGLLEFNELIQETPVNTYRTKDGKRVREITYYSDKSAIEFVYWAGHPLDPQPPNTVHKSENYLDLIKAIKNIVVEKWDADTEALVKENELLD